MTEPQEAPGKRTNRGSIYLLTEVTFKKDFNALLELSVESRQ